MSDKDQNLEKPNEEPKEPEVQPAAEPKKTEDEYMIPKSRLDEVIEQRDMFEKRIKALETKIEDDNKKRLKEQEDYRALYEQAEGELAELKPKAERAQTLEESAKKSLDAMIAEIPESKRSLIPSAYPVDQQIEWISQNRALLSKSPPIDLGAGKGGNGAETSVVLTPEQKAMADKTGVSYEDYAKNLK